MGSRWRDGRSVLLVSAGGRCDARTEASGMMAGLPCPGAATKAAGIRRAPASSNLNHGQDTRANRTQPTTSSSTQPHVKQNPPASLLGRGPRFHLPSCF